MQKRSTYLLFSFLNAIQQNFSFKKHVVAGNLVLMASCLLGMQATVAQVCNSCSNIVTNSNFSNNFSGWTVVGPWTGPNATAYYGNPAMTLSQTVTGLNYVPAQQVGNVVLTFNLSSGNNNGSGSPTADVANMFVELGGTTYLTITNGSTNTIAFSTGSSGATLSYSPNPYVITGSMWANSTAVTLTIPWPSASKPNSALLNFRFVTSNQGDDMGISNVSILGGAAILPIKLSSMTATKKDNAVLLNWTTATEINNQGFKILRSANGRSFDTLAFVPSRAANHGNSTAALSYSFIDHTPTSGTNYYRIAQIDKDGKTEVSFIVQVAADEVKDMVKVYPDPVSKELHVQGVTAGASFKIINLSGRTVATATSSTIPVSGLPAGTYFLRVEQGSASKTIKFIKK